MSRENQHCSECSHIDVCRPAYETQQLTNSICQGSAITSDIHWAILDALASCCVVYQKRVEPKTQEAT